MRVLLQGFDLLATFDDEDRELVGADILVDGSVIEAVGTRLGERPGVLEAVDEVVDCRGLVGLPGLVNAHQHLYQAAFRAVPRLERVLIDPWLAGLGALVKARYREGRFGVEVVGAVAEAVLTESLLGGVTTVADQHYFFPAGASLRYVEATIEAAATVGVRLHACRGTLTAGPDPDVTQSVEAVVAHCAELIGDFHDPTPGAMIRVALAPCGVHVDDAGLFSQLAGLAQDHPEVRLHTHLYEKVDDAFCRAPPWLHSLGAGRPTDGRGPAPGWRTWSTRPTPRSTRWRPPAWPSPTCPPPTCAWGGGPPRCGGSSTRA